MAGNWMDEHERDERDWRRTDYEGRWPERGDRQYRSENRSFRGDSYYQGDGGYEGGRDRVFGERESGASYGGRSNAGRGWQAPNYGGVSPAMRQGEYSAPPRFTRQDYRGGGRYYGDDDRERIYREEYGQGGVEYGDVPTGYDADGYSPTRARYHAEGYGQPGYGGYAGYATDYRREMNRPASGGTGGYDYERGYGDGGRRESRGERFERAGRGAGDFLHRAGERVASWFGAGSESRIYDPDYLNPNPNATRGARGLGPQGYKRSDERISDEAHDRLTDDTWLDASSITISVSGGEITLSGTVESREAKHRAERLVEDLAGVNHVQNNLRVARGNPLTSAGSGYGDSVLGAQLRRDEPATNGSGGSGGGQSTAGRKS